MSMHTFVYIDEYMHICSKYSNKEVQSCEKQIRDVQKHAWYCSFLFIQKAALKSTWTSEWRRRCACVCVYVFESCVVSWGPFAWATSSFWQEQHSDLQSHMAVPCKLIVFGAVTEPSSFRSMAGSRVAVWSVWGNDTSDFADVEAVKAATNLKLQLEATAQKATWCHCLVQRWIRSWNSHEQKLNSANFLSWFRTLTKISADYASE